LRIFSERDFQAGLIADGNLLRKVSDIGHLQYGVARNGQRELPIQVAYASVAGAFFYNIGADNGFAFRVRYRAGYCPAGLLCRRSGQIPNGRRSKRTGRHTGYREKYEDTSFR